MPPASSSWAIRTVKLRKHYRGGQGIQQVSLQVPRGSIYGFLGPNGAGKTTTIRLLLGLLQPEYGSIELLGQSLQARPNVLAKVGALVEAPSLYPHLSGRRNLEITQRLRGVARQRVADVLDITRLAAAADRRVGEYSLGMRQRLGIALALLGSPELLILDEPTNGLDPAGIADLRQMLHKFAHDSGITILVSSHLLAEVEQIATHVGILHGGELRFQGSIDELRRHSTSRVRLLCSPPEQAATWLNQNGFSCATGTTDSWLTIAAESRQVPRLIQHLFDAGVTVQDLALEQSSLETMFFELTGDPTTAKEVA
ncbi:MAG: ABC transporter ATP-binding protein [Rhodanobacter sp.]